MKLVDLLGNFQALGTLVLGAVADGEKRPVNAQEWIAFLGSSDVLDNVKDIVSRFEGEDFAKLADEAEAKQAELEAGRPFASLTPEEQAQSMALGNVAIVLRGQDVAKHLQQDPATVIGETILPIVERALPLALAAL